MGRRFEPCRGHLNTTGKALIPRLFCVLPTFILPKDRQEIMLRTPFPDIFNLMTLFKKLFTIKNKSLAFLFIYVILVLVSDTGL